MGTVRANDRDTGHVERTAAVRSRPSGLRWIAACALAWLVSSPGLSTAPKPVFEVPRARVDVVLDGVIDEPVWNDALTVELGYEVRPSENTPAPVRTVCRVLYDDRFMYFAFRAYDPEPTSIRARYTDRDEAWNDDWVGVAIDTFDDQRRAYEFMSNPLGIQIDAINDDVNGNYDTSWNAIWRSAGRLTDFGYEVEMAVPFNQIRFEPKNGRQVWGFDAFRSYPREIRHHIGLFARERGSNTYVGQFVKLRGMEGVEAGRNLEIIPTVTASRSESRAAFPRGDLEARNETAEIGATVRWGVTPNVRLNAAANPDFSQVEADVLQLAINEQFTLFFPETRPFFKDGSDFFDTPASVVYTRSIADPSAAGKLTAKSGAHTYGVMAARDDVTNVVFPGAFGSTSGSFDIESTTTVGRYRYDLGSGSTIGAIVTDRRGEGGYENTVAGADLQWRPTPNDRLRFHAVGSRTRYSDDMVAAQGVRDDRFGGSAVRARYRHQQPNWYARGAFDAFSDDYRADVGFQPQVGFSRWVAGAGRIWWGDATSTITRMEWGGDVERATTESGELLEEEAETWFNAQGPWQSRVDFGAGARTRVFQGVSFDQAFGRLGLEARPNAAIWARLDVDFGDWIDFANVRPADRLSVRPRLTLNLGRHFLSELRHTYLRLDVDRGRLFEVQAPEVRLIWQFSARSFLRSILQYTHVERDPSLYEDTVDREEQDLFTQLLYAYKVNPQTALYVGYSDDRIGTETLDLTTRSRAFFVKVGYAWLR